MKSNVDVTRPYTWIKFRGEEMCRDCESDCCKMAVEVKLPDLVRIGILDEFETGEDIRKIGKRLKKEGYVRLFNLKTEIFILPQYQNKDCIYLDQETRKCTIYERRPETCRNHPKVGPRPGYCCYRKKKRLMK